MMNDGSLSVKAPLLLLEINEVPWRLVDRLCFDQRFPSVREFFSRAQTYTTETMDKGELSPWITWPTIHRGIPNTEHGIQFLGQDPSSFRGTPVWIDFRKCGYSIGVCGSLHSWPAIDPGPDGFFIPDAYAQSERCIPRTAEPVQDFILKLTREHGNLGVSPANEWTKSQAFVNALRELRIPQGIETTLKRHFEQEQRDATTVLRRPTLHMMLQWELFKSLYNPQSPPTFSTFFTNHVATMLHQFFHEIFPDDFSRSSLEHIDNQENREAIAFGFKALNDLLFDALALLDVIPSLKIVFLASMGQSAVDQKDHPGLEAVFTNSSQMMSRLGFIKNDWCERNAMVPQLALHFENTKARTAARKIFETAKSASGAKVFDVMEAGSTISLTLRRITVDDIMAWKFSCFDAEGTQWHELTWEEAGIEVVRNRPGTGYHMSEGAMAVIGTDLHPRDSRKKIRATDVKQFLFDLAFPAGRSPEIA